MGPEFKSSRVFWQACVYPTLFVEERSTEYRIHWND